MIRNFAKLESESWPSTCAVQKRAVDPNTRITTKTEIVVFWAKWYSEIQQRVEFAKSTEVQLR